MKNPPPPLLTAFTFLRVCLGLLPALFIPGKAIGQRDLQQRLRHVVDSVYSARPATVGIIVHVKSPGRRLSWSYATGEADKNTHEKLSADRPVLLASNTKTYVAATILRLAEQGAVRIDQPVQKLIHPATAALLTDAGYRLERITLRQLLSHTSGIRDYVDDAYFDSVNARRTRQWSRAEQIALAAKMGGPYAAPGDSFRYADVNYLLLTEVIETRTGKPFYVAMRSLLGYKANGLAATWFVQLEKQPAGLPPMAHQYWNKYPWDAREINPSWDLYGGGGLAATTKDLARFFQQLFSGRIVRDTAVLARMHEDVPSGTPTNYCLGVRKVQIGGLTGYYHGGFWGTDAIYFPALKTSIAITVLERSERALSAGICAAIVAALPVVPGEPDAENRR